MTVFAGPQDGATGNMSQSQWEEVESRLWSNGVIAFARNTFTTTTTTGLGISTNTGDAILDGFRFFSDAAVPNTAATADPSLDRIDLLVLRVDEAAHTATIALKTGTPAASPVAPTPTQTVGGTYELGIYQVRVNAASATITSLTDVRAYTAPTLAGATTADFVKKAGDTMTGQLSFNKTLSSSNEIQGWQQGYGLFSDNVASGAFAGATTRLWVDSPANGEMHIGGRTGGNVLKGLRLRAIELLHDDNVTQGKIWSALNDGAGSGLDADKLDNLESAAFAQLAALANFTAGLQKSGKDVLFAQAGLTGKFSAQTTAPASPADGDLWLDTSVTL